MPHPSPRPQRALRVLLLAGCLATGNSIASGPVRLGPRMLFWTCEVPQWSYASKEGPRSVCTRDYVIAVGEATFIAVDGFSTVSATGQEHVFANPVASGTWLTGLTPGKCEWKYLTTQHQTYIARVTVVGKPWTPAFAFTYRPPAGAVVAELAKMVRERLAENGWGEVRAYPAGPLLKVELIRSLNRAQRELLAETIAQIVDGRH
jgi:hypothetical protein